MATLRKSAVAALAAVAPLCLGEARPWNGRRGIRHPGRTSKDFGSSGNLSKSSTQETAKEQSSSAAQVGTEEALWERI